MQRPTLSWAKVRRETTTTEGVKGEDVAPRRDWLERAPERLTEKTAYAG